jgi:flavin reductase (DIM6/NTAB) family NADH-FMN oxidoreductase RutF
MNEENLSKSIDPELLRQAMRSWTTGVTVVTSFSAGTRYGMTVNSFTSVSLDPPVVSVALANTTRTHSLVKKSGIFAVTILAEGQGEVSDQFAGKVVGAPQDDPQPEMVERFTGIETFFLKTGAPLIDGGLAYLDCQVIYNIDIGTTTVFFGKVLAVQLTTGGKPLAYFNRIYRRLQL